MVPPVPTPATMASMLWPLSSQISGPVVRSWMAGLAGLSNCCGIQASSFLATSSLALAMAPFMPSLAGVSTRLAPSARSKRAPFDRHRLGHGQRQPIALGRAHEGQGDAGVAACRFDDVRVRDEPCPPRSPASIMATPMRSLTLLSG